MKPFAELTTPLEVVDYDQNEKIYQTKAIAFELDSIIFTPEQLEAIEQEVGQHSKFIIIGESTSSQEIKNRAMLVIFQDGVPHDLVLQYLWDNFPGMTSLKDAGFLDLAPNGKGFWGTSESLKDELNDDQIIKRKWRNFYLAKYSGLSVEPY